MKMWPEDVQAEVEQDKGCIVPLFGEKFMSDFCALQ